MPYSKEYTTGKTFVGVMLPNRLHAEFSRLCALARRSKAQELRTATEERVRQLQQQERRGTINGVR